MVVNSSVVRPLAPRTTPAPLGPVGSGQGPAPVQAQALQASYYNYAPYYPYPVRQEPTLGRVASWGLGAWAGLRLAASTFSSSPQGLAALGVAALGAWGGSKVYDWLRSQGAF